MIFKNVLPILGAALLSISCSSTIPHTADVALSEKVLGFDDDVRVEATLYPDPFSTGGNMRIICEVENRRQEPILIYDIESIGIYDPESRTFTINFGSEVPAPEAKRVEILSAERRTFERTVSLQGIPPLLQRVTTLIRVRLHFLREAFVAGTPEQEEPSFFQWAEYKRTVDTNSIPVH